MPISFSGARSASLPPARRNLPRASAGRPLDRSLGGRFARCLNRNRRLVVALLLCAAAGVAVQQLTPAPAHTVTALAAGRDLPAGAVLDGQDVVQAAVPPDVLPSGSFTDTTALHGKQLAVPLRKGQLIADAQLLGPGLLAGTAAGSAAVPLRMADPSSVQLVSPGQLVDVVLTSGDGYERQSASEVLAESVPVLWTSAHGGKTGEWLGTNETEGLIVVAADAQQALRLAGASTQGKLFFVLVGTRPG